MCPGVGEAQAKAGDWKGLRFLRRGAVWQWALTLLTSRPAPPVCAERPDFTDAIILRKGASVEHVVS